ncbi:MAG: hypothetical protein JXR64_06070 [Spirochaetales bacterium]|nr:hypothetical protein [Spirochaetales bacterium]
MIVNPKENFKPLITFLDKINPILIIISIIGLFMEYTSFKAFVLLPNKIISILFVIDFLIRIISFDPVKYFIYGYGWVDFLASMPGIFFFLNNTPLFTVFKIIKVGRFFKIIRILRFLRVFSFLKKMKADSVWIQDRIMKIGITIVLIFIIGIIFIDSTVDKLLTENEILQIENEYINLQNDIFQLMKNNNEIVYILTDRVLYDRNGNIINDYTVINNLMADELENYLLVSFSENQFVTKNNLELPFEGIIKKYSDFSNYQNIIMIGLLTTLLTILTIMIFYMGFVFAKDIQVIQLIIDSFDADDDLLLKQEGDKLRSDDGIISIDPNDNEILNLLKAAVIKSESSSSNNDDLFMNIATGIGVNNEIDTNELIEETIKKLTPAIVKYIKKELKH